MEKRRGLVTTPYSSWGDLDVTSWMERWRLQHEHYFRRYFEVSYVRWNFLLLFLKNVNFAVTYITRITSWIILIILYDCDLSYSPPTFIRHTRIPKIQTLQPLLINNLTISFFYFCNIYIYNLYDWICNQIYFIMIISL